MTRMFLAYPFLLGDLSEVKRIDTLARHAVLAARAGCPDVGLEYLAEIARRGEASRLVCETQHELEAA